MKKIALLLFALTAVVLGFVLSSYFMPKQLSLISGTWFKQPMALDEFRLVDFNNKPFGKERFKGQWDLLFFGYTHCPDVCPDSLNMLREMVKHLTPEARKKLQVYFISVDPWRDTPEKIKSYVTYYNADFMGASADTPELEVLTKKLGIIHYIRKEGDEYAVAHSGAMTLINPDAEYNAVFSPPHDAQKMASDLQQIIDN